MIYTDCKKNPHKFLCFRWYGKHDLDLLLLEPWGNPDWFQYRIQAVCKKCGARFSEFGVDEQILVRSGLIQQPGRELE
jgi:hypothetical protein